MTGVVLCTLLALAVSAPLVTLAAAPGSAVETYACWAERGRDDDTAHARRAVVCRIAGELTDTFDGPAAVPAVLHVAVGSDTDGPCWFWSTAPSGWRAVRTDGRYALLRFDPDGPGAAATLADGWVRRCGAEPEEDPDLLDLVWQIVRRHPLPRPSVEVEPGLGLAGMGSYVTGLIPPPVRDGAASPVTGLRVEVEIEVAAVRVDWGDHGDAAAVPADGADRLSGWPDGSLRHVYEAAGEYAITVAYDWVVRWRAAGEEWNRLPLAPTEIDRTHRVQEIVARRTS